MSRSGRGVDASRELHILRVRALRRLLESDDPKAIARGLRHFKAFEQERRKIIELELQHAKAGTATLTYERLGRVRLRVQVEEQPQGPSPDQASAMISEFMAERKEREAEQAVTEDTEQPAAVAGLSDTPAR